MREGDGDQSLPSVKILTTIVCLAALALAGCAQQLTPQQVQIVAATTAATLALAGSTVQAVGPKKLDPAKVQAITNASVQATQLIGQAAATWSPSPTPAPSPPH
jgi:hypothetical protein